jgi:hypothetical protein
MLMESFAIPNPTGVGHHVPTASEPAIGGCPLTEFREMPLATFGADAARSNGLAAVRSHTILNPTAVYSFPWLHSRLPYDSPKNS